MGLSLPLVTRPRQRGDRMRRREVFLSLLAVSASLPSVAQDRKRLVGILIPYPAEDREVQARLLATREELRRLGWSEGKNLKIEERWPGDDLARIEEAAADLVRRKPDVLFVTGGRVVPIVLKHTRTIPIVFVNVSDPLGRGLGHELIKRVAEAGEA